MIELDIEVWKIIGLSLGVIFTLFTLFLIVTFFIGGQQAGNYSPALPTIQPKTADVKEHNPFDADEFVPTNNNQKRRPSLSQARLTRDSTTLSVQPNRVFDSVDEDDDFALTTGRD